jgi:hypothetical protein
MRQAPPANNFVFLMAHSFSGSTLLSFLLGAHPEVATVGEMYISPEFNQDGYLCSCGERIGDCPFWRRVSQEMAAQGVPFDIRSADTSFRADGLNGLAHRLIAAEPHGPLFEAARRAALRLLPATRREIERRLRVNEALVQVITGLCGAHSFVDASKRPGRLLLLAQIPSFDTRVIHLVRDGRAVACSSMRNLGRTAEEGARSWTAALRSAELARRRFSPERWLTVRHEDLCRDPDAELGKIFRFLGVASSDFRPQGFREIEHHIIGNRMRLSRTSEIRLDERWRAELAPEQIRAVEQIAGPDLRRYGYESA